MRRHLCETTLRALGLLIICATLLSLTWAVFTPPWEGPDETMHYAYVESLAQRHERPGVEAGRVFSSSQSLSMRSSNADKLTRISDGRPQWSRAAAERDERLPARRKDDGGGSRHGFGNTARENPPAFYVFQLAPYAAGVAADDVNTGLYAMRVLAILALVVMIAGTWLLVGELVPRAPFAQLAGAASVGLLPMVSHISGSVSPDAWLYALWTLALWLGVRSLKRGLTVRVGVALVAVTIAALLTKFTSFALVPPVIGVLAIGLWRKPSARARVGYVASPVRLLGASAAVAAVAIAVGVVVGLPTQLANQLTGSIDAGRMTSYLWQFYLPRLPFQYDIPTVTGIPVYDVWFKDLAGNFASLQIQQPGWLYAFLGVVALLTAVLGARTLLRTQPRSVTVFLGVTMLLLVMGLHLTDYRHTVEVGSSVGFMQGRYLLPLVGVFAALVGAAWTWVPERRRPGITALLLGCLLALQVISFSRAAGFWYV